MYFLGIGTVVDPAGLAALQGEEDETLRDLRRDGTVVQAFRRVQGHGVVGIFEGPDLETVTRQVSRLPFVTHGHLHFEYDELAQL